MTIAIKNGRPILAGGVLAQNCNCCKPCPCSNNLALERQVHSEFAPGWACAPGHPPPDQIKVRVDFTAAMRSGYSVTKDAKGPIFATPFTITAPSGSAEYVLNRVLAQPLVPAACVYVTPFAIVGNGYRSQGAITIRPGLKLGSGWEAVMSASTNPYGFNAWDILGVTTAYGAQIPWASFSVGAQGDDQLPSDCVTSNSKSTPLSGGERYSLFPSALLEPNAKLSGFQWAFCFETGTEYKAGPNVSGFEWRRMKIAVISVVDL